jgi:Fe-S-cluster-containing hydrogenase component 2
MAACPEEGAMVLDPATGAVAIVESLCTACSKCIGACDIGAIRLVRQRGRGKNGKAVAVKCNQCGGQPWCVKVCEPRALEFVEATPELNGQHVFERLREARAEAEVLLAGRGAQPRRRVKIG